MLGVTLLAILLIKYFTCSFNKRNFINSNTRTNIEASVVLVFVVSTIKNCDVFNT